MCAGTRREKVKATRTERVIARVRHDKRELRDIFLHLFSTEKRQIWSPLFRSSPSLMDFSLFSAFFSSPASLDELTKPSYSSPRKAETSQVEAIFHIKEKLSNFFAFSAKSKFTGFVLREPCTCCCAFNVPTEKNRMNRRDKTFFPVLFRADSFNDLQLTPTESEVD